MNGDAMTGFKKKFLISFSLFSFTILMGTAGYYLIGKGQYSLMDCFYMTVITVATVGYREVVDIAESAGGKLFTVFLIFSGMSVILYFLSNVTAFLIEGDIKEIFWRKKMQKLIGRLRGHHIVCGTGRLGWHVVEELHLTGRHVVAVDMDTAALNALREKYPAVGIVHGDATDNDVLQEAGIAHASGLVAATGNDRDNLVVTLTARQASASLRIITRCNDIKNTEKLKRAGADSVVSSNLIGGLRMASDLVRPAVVSFLDRMLRDRDKNLRVEEAGVPAGSPLVGKPAGEVKRHVLLLAIQAKDGSYEYNPPDGRTIEEGATFIFMGAPEERTKIESLLGLRAPAQ